MKKVKYFFDFLESQEKWLNNMSKAGYRLVKAGKLVYEFEKCIPSEYVYSVEFVADKSNNNTKNYHDFLENEIDYRCFSKNINLNYSLGKTKLRPWAKGMGKISTSPGSFNKELLIVEKKNDNKEFKLHTCTEDLVRYLTPIRNMYVFTTLFLMTIILINLYKESLDIATLQLITLLIIPIIFLSTQSAKYIHIVKKYKREIKFKE